MSKLNALIEELCPEGVEYRKIKECYTRLKGTPITAEKMKEIQSGDGEIKIFAGGKTAINAYEKDIPNANITRVPAVLVQSRGIIDVIYYEKPFTFKNEMWAYTTNEKISVKFLYYVLKNNIHIFRDAASGMGSLPQISLKVTEEFEIPISPLEVQAEIVRILDKFTHLQELLKTELHLRKKQYEYYRDKLLTFDDEVEWKTIKDLFDTRNGYTPSTKNNKFWDNGTIPWFVMDDIRTNGRILSESKQHITKDAVKGSGLFKKNSIIVATSATIGEHALITTDFISNQRFTCLYPKKEFEAKIDMKFVFYYAFILDEFCKNNTTVSSFASVDMKKFYDFKFPIPPLAEQERIVSILDRFDALCHDLTSGIPAEIAARQKQYEYYRDKLLTFKRKEN